MQVKTQGLIIREQTIGESDRLVTVLTRDEGVVRAFARRAKNLKDSKNSATGLLCYSRLNLYKGREKYIINDAFPIEVFFGLRKDIVRLSLAQYFCELAFELVPEGVESAEYLRLVLNGLHFLCEGTKPEALLKPIVELRMLPKSNVSVAVESLIQRGLLCRRQDTADRRRIHLSLTNSAAPLLEDVLAVMPRFTACALSGFTAEETHDFEQFYYRIAQNISLCLQKEGTLHE